jgi:CubicO group peptidase (beta-lactamase class C family)
MAIEYSIEGTCNESFIPVKEAFHQNFLTGLEVGASLAIIHNDELIVDLWGGFSDGAFTRPWERDTLVNVFSTTKMVTALCILHLADQGRIDLDQPLAAYWPEFTRDGKDQILIRQVLSHTAGLPGFTPQIRFEDQYDWQNIIHLLEAEKPWWKPGTRLGYHTLTYGYLLGEIVRRVTGKTLGQYLREEITSPLGIDFFIGLPEEEEPRVAEIVPMRQEFTKAQLSALKVIFPMAIKIAVNPYLDVRKFNTRACHAAEIPAGNGMGNARSVARLGSILAGGGTINGKQILSRKMVERAILEQARGRDKIAFGRPSAWGLGVMLLNKALLLGPRSFYATGLGGSVCVMDLDRNLTLVYAMNKMAELAEGDSRSIPLVHKMWECLPAQ